MFETFSSFFDLRDNPFRANPDPRYLFLTPKAKETLDQILEGIRERKGLLLLTGEVGTGKTVLLNRLMERLEQERIPKAFIFNSHLKVSELLELILADFGVPFNAQRGTPLAHLHSWLRDRHCAGQSPVLFVDEAQGLSRSTLEELRMLLNLQTPEGSLLQIVLCGQPEFEETLNRPELRQLRQRIALRCRTSPLTLDETRSYIDARLRVAGGAGAAVVFHPEAVHALQLYSRGLPRVLNALCEKSLMRAASEKTRPVPGRFVGEAAHELQYDEFRPFARRSAADDAVSSDVFARRPDFAGAPDISAATAPFGQAAPLDYEAPGMPSGEPQLFAGPAASESARMSSAHSTAYSKSAESGSSAPRTSHAPIKFPSPSQHEPPSSPASSEIIARLARVSKTSAPSEPRIVERASNSVVVAPVPVAPKGVVRQENDFRRHWRQHRISVMRNTKSALSALASESRIRLARLQTRAVSLFDSLSRQVSGWRDKNWKPLKIGFQWRDFAFSFLRWLRAPSNATRRHHPQPQPQVRAPLTESSARILAAHALRRRSLPQAGASKVIGSLKNAPSFSASILHWLQEPSHSVRRRKPTHLSSTRLS